MEEENAVAVNGVSNGYNHQSTEDTPPAYSDIEMKNKDTDLEEQEEDDPWVVSDLIDNSIPWAELDTCGRVKRVLWNYIFRQVLLIGLLYLFICSLDFLSSAFRLLGGKAAGKVFAQNDIFNNPVAGLMMGVLVTVLVQSSSTSTSIVVSMVGADLLSVRVAIPIIMGANIGTSVTNTIVSLGQSGDRNQFRRAFGGATVHDMFNWLSVVILLPLELISGYLFELSHAIVYGSHFNVTTYEGGDVKLLKAITGPFTQYVIKIDKNEIKKIALNDSYNPATLIKTKNTFMFMNVAGPDSAGAWPDWVIGLILLIIALFILCTCLVLIVKILNDIFRGHIAYVLKKFINADFPGACGKHGTGYLAILLGALFTILVQSSSIFTSALTPLVGVGVITLERMYPLTLGANIGTTCTAILAALAGDELAAVQRALQVSICHLFFNISGIIIWYPLPFMRNVPIRFAKILGNTTAKYRWFAVMYLLIAFLALPALVFGLSIPGWYVLLAVGGPIFLLFILIIIINVIQRKRPLCLPARLRTWNFLPEPMHSLKPIDRVIKKLTRCCRANCRCCRKEDSGTITDDKTLQAAAYSRDVEADQKF